MKILVPPSEVCVRIEWGKSLWRTATAKPLFKEHAQEHTRRPLLQLPGPRQPVPRVVTPLHRWRNWDQRVRPRAGARTLASGFLPRCHGFQNPSALHLGLKLSFQRLWERLRLSTGLGTIITVLTGENTWFLLGHLKSRGGP